ncbi:Stp1/IreP family PP2C-type Ser/Thr phosphatase [Nitrospira japonica]|nr:Stp1/IreP family PP2C-type Ser/Thr phosphatase [Nitrospira japonica]
MRTLHSVRSDVGLKRTHNEDRFLADPAIGVYAVCDGMGGGNAGEVASALAVETIHAHLRTGRQDDRVSMGSDANLSPNTHRLAGAIRAANESIHEASWTNPSYAGMGTTIVAVHLSNDLLSIAHVGDSRLYLIRNGKIDALTADHSWVAEQVRRGLMTEGEAERSSKRNIVTRALGVERVVDVELGEIPVRHGDRFLLCSDGLTRGVRTPDILRAVEAASDVEDSADRLLAMANDAGGDDNTTVLLLSLFDEASSPFWRRLTQRWFPMAS